MLKVIDSWATSFNLIKDQSLLFTVQKKKNKIKMTRHFLFIAHDYMTIRYPLLSLEVTTFLNFFE